MAASHADLMNVLRLEQQAAAHEAEMAALSAATERVPRLREHAVPCQRCVKRETWENDAVCRTCKTLAARCP